MKEKSSQEILSHLQRKSFNNKSKIPKLITNEIESEFPDENLPPTRIKEFLNITNSQLSTSLNKNNNMNNNKSKSNNAIQERKNNFLFDFKIKENKTKEKSKIKISNEQIITPSFFYESYNTKNNIINENINKNVNTNNNKEKISNNNNYNINKEKEKEKENEKEITYLDFNLHENIYKSKDKKYPLHAYLPIKYKDNESYKTNLLNFLKYENKNNPQKSTAYKTQNENHKINSIINKNFTKQKIKKIFSVKKKSFDKINFFQNKKEVDFFLYKDSDIGLEKIWQIPITYQEYDNDIESDDEQVIIGRNKMIYDIGLGIVKWSQNKNFCWNYRYVNHN